MSIEEASLSVPVEARAHFSEQAARLVLRAEARQASRTEIELALGALAVLCGAGRTRTGAEP